MTQNNDDRKHLGWGWIIVFAIVAFIICLGIVAAFFSLNIQDPHP